MEKSGIAFMHADLVEIGRKWLMRPWRNAAVYGHGACPVVLTELSTTTGTSEIPDVLGFTSRESILIECKVSRADFRADARKAFRKNPADGVGRQRYYLAPQGVIPEEEIPEGWGLIEAGGNARTRVVRHTGIFTEYRSDVEVQILFSAIRRLKIAEDGHVSVRVFPFTFQTKSRASLSVAAEVP